MMLWLPPEIPGITVALEIGTSMGWIATTVHGRETVLKQLHNVQKTKRPILAHF